MYISLRFDMPKVQNKIKLIGGESIMCYVVCFTVLCSKKYECGKWSSYDSIF